MDTSKKLEIVSRGKMSELVFQQIEARLIDEKSRVLNTLKNSYRNGQGDEITLNRGIAALVALDDFETRLLNDMKAANRAAKELYESSKPS